MLSSPFVYGIIGEWRVVLTRYSVKVARKPARKEGSTSIGTNNVVARKSYSTKVAVRYHWYSLLFEEAHHEYNTCSAQGEVDLNVRSDTLFRLDLEDLGSHFKMWDQGKLKIN